MAAIDDVLAERAKQDAKWGEQNHDPILWSAILGEECGEFAQAALHARFGGDKAQGLRDEAIQVAAVAVAIVECLDRTATRKAQERKCPHCPCKFPLEEMYGWVCQMCFLATPPPETASV